MASCELKGELRYRNGETNSFVVKSETNLKSLVAGVKKLSSEVSEVLTRLVEEEKSSAGDKKNAHADGLDEEEDDDSDEQDDATDTAPAKPNSEPPAKRLKALRS